MLPRNKIFVGSLPPSTKPEEVRRLFENYGVVTECDVMNRCAFVHMQTPDMVDNAIQALHNSNFKGVTINVERGRTKERAPGGGGDGRDSGGRGGFRGGRGGFNQQSRSNYDDGDRSVGPMRNNRGNMRQQPYGSGGGAGRGGSFDGQSQGGGGGGFRGGRGGGRGDFSDRGSGGRGGGGNNSSGGSGGSRFSGGQQSEDRRGFALPNESADRFSGARSGGLAMSSFKDPFVRRSIGDTPAGPSAPYVNRGIYSQGNNAATAQATASYNQAFPPLGSDAARNVSRGPPPAQPQQQQGWMQQ